MNTTWSEEKRQFIAEACKAIRETPIGDGRKVWDLLTDERSRRAVIVTEKYLAGEATGEQPWDAAWDAADASKAARDAGGATYMAAWAAAHAAMAAAHVARGSADAPKYAYAAVVNATGAAYAAEHADND